MRHVKNFIAWLSEVAKVLYYLCDKIWPFFLLAGSLLLIVGTLLHINTIKGLAIGTLLMVACFLICRKVYENEAMPLLGMVSLMLHFVISIIFNYAFKSFGTDSIEYHYLASEITELLNSGVGYRSVSLMKQMFPNFVALIYYAIGANRLAATFVVSFFAVLTGVVVYLIGYVSNTNKSLGYFGSLAIWFMPGFLFFTSDLLKDSCILLLTAVSFYLFAVLIYKKSTLLEKSVIVIILMITIVINSAFRFYVFAPIVIGLGLSLVIYFFNNRGLKIRLIALVLILGFIILFYILVNRYLNFYISLDINKLFERINIEREWEFAYATAGIKGYDISTFIKAIKALPELCLHYLAQPFPSLWFSDGELYIRLLIPDMLAWYVMIPFLFFGGYITVVKKNFVGISMVGYLIAFLCINALIVGNIGAIYRYRLQLQEISFLLVGIGAYEIRNKLRNAQSVL